MNKIKLAQRTISLLISMIESGERHTARSREMKDNALEGLKQLTIPVVVSASKCIYKDCRNSTASDNYMYCKIHKGK